MKMMMLAITQVTWHTRLRDVSGNVFRRMKTPDPHILPGSNPRPIKQMKHNTKMFILPENLILLLCLNFY